MSSVSRFWGCSKGDGREKGTALVEAAIVSLAFMVALFAVIELGRLMNVQQTLTDAVREGARFAVAPLSGTSDLPSEAAIEAEVNRFLNAARLQAAVVNIQRPEVTASGDELTRVTATFDYQIVTLSLFSATTIELSATAAMRNETSP